MVNFHTFVSTIKDENDEVSFVATHEHTMGGPPLGNLELNGDIIFPDYTFSGPLLVRNRKVFIPKFQNKLWRGWGYVLFEVDLDSKLTRTLSRWQELVLLDSVESGVVSFFTDVDNKNKISVEL